MFRRLLLASLIALCIAPVASAQFSRITSITGQQNTGTQAFFAASPFTIKAGPSCTWTVSGTIYTFECSGGAASSVPFSGITNGTNTTATMTVGTGASLGFSGSGTVTASNTTAANTTVLFSNSGTITGETDFTYTASANTLKLNGAMGQVATMLDIDNNTATAALGLLSVHGDAVGDADGFGSGVLLNLMATTTSPASLHEIMRVSGLSADHYWTRSMNTVNGSFVMYGTDDNMTFTGFTMVPSTHRFTFDGGFGGGFTYPTAPRYDTIDNCTDSTGDAACGNASEGAVVVDATDTTTVVSTTAVTANSNVSVQYSPYLGSRLGVTCNATGVLPSVTAITAATSFTITLPVAPIANPACFVYRITN